MRGSKGDIPVAVEIPEATIRQAEWGGISVEIGEIKGKLDVAPLFKGLPNDECQCPHWGYVLKGRLRYRSGDREEVFNAGDAYYVGPGHIPVFEEGLEYVEFSPADVLQQTMEIVERNMAALAGAQ
jgi:hypothetical protein